MARASESGPPIEPVYGPHAPEGREPVERLGRPFARGGYPSMHTGRPWTMRQNAGFGLAAESNARYRQLIADGTRQLSVAFDLPTQRGHDSDGPLAHGEVGKAGVAIDSLDDMRVLFSGIPLDTVSTSMTINAPSALLLLLYQLVGEEVGVAAGRLTGSIHNDVLEERITRSTCIFPSKPSLRLTADVFRYCRAEIPQWNPISLSGHHMAQAGASPVQEIAFTLANGIEYVRTAVAADLDADDFAPRLSFFFVARTTILEEVATFRAARRIWARLLQEEFGARSLAPVTATAELSAGSHAIEAMTNDMEAQALELMRRIAELGGAVEAIEQGFQRDEIERGAYRIARETDAGERFMADVDRFRLDVERYTLPHVDRAVEVRQAERLARLRAWRDQERVNHSLALMQNAAAGEDNVLYPMKDALAAGATVGEVCDALRTVWGSCHLGGGKGAGHPVTPG